MNAAYLIFSLTFLLNNSFLTFSFLFKEKRVKKRSNNVCDKKEKQYLFIGSCTYILVLKSQVSCFDIDR